MLSSRRSRAYFAIGAIAILLSVASAGYVVRPGDTLSEIAKEHQTTISELTERNEISNPNRIYVGQVLEIPVTNTQTTTQRVLTQGSKHHTISSGETLASIAIRYGVSVHRLAELNGISDPSLIYAGSRLTISQEGDPGDDNEPTEKEDISAEGSDTGSAENTPDSTSPSSPAGSQESSSKPKQVIHIVSGGDSLSRIARLYQTSVSQLVEINQLSNPNFIRIGQQLRVSLAPTEPTDLDRVPGPEPAVENPNSETSQSGEEEPPVGERSSQEEIEPEVEKEDAASDTTEEEINPEQPGASDNDGASEDDDTPEETDPREETKLNELAVFPDPEWDEANWMCPVPGGTFFDDWGDIRSGGRLHEGNDIVAPVGTPIFAPVPGVVEQILSLRGGNQFTLKGVDGHTYIGTHLDRFGASGYVQAGEVIGYVGYTGNASATVPHLHFEYHPDGKGPVNPFSLLIEHC